MIGLKCQVSFDIIGCIWVKERVYRTEVRRIAGYVAPEDHFVNDLLVCGAAVIVAIQMCHRMGNICTVEWILRNGFVFIY